MNAPVRPGTADVASRESPELTVVIPTRDRASLAARAISSALRQTLAGVEVVVVDDGSAEPFRFDDERVRVARHAESRGLCAARNTGMDAARGRWITFLDDDDELLPHMAQVSLESASRSTLPEPVAVLSGIDILYEGRRVRTRLPVTLPKGRHFLLEQVDHGTFQATNSLVAPTEVVRAIGGWDEQIRGNEMPDFFLRLNQVCSLQGIDEVTYVKHVHGAGHLHDKLLVLAEGTERTIAKHRHLFRAHRRASGSVIGRLGLYYLRGGKWGAAVDRTTRALLRNPTNPQILRWWLSSLAGPRAYAWYRTRRPAHRAILGMEEVR